MNTQLTLFADPKEARFLEWKSTPGGAHILGRYIYPLAAKYSKRFQRNGQIVSMKLIWELVRDRMRYVRKYAAKRGIKIKRSYGYALNNDYTPYVARHIYSRRPEWTGMFELRAADDIKPKHALVIPIQKRKVCGDR